MNKNETTIREFIHAWSTLDAEELAGYFTEDGIYHNMPIQPVVGRDNIKTFIAGFSASWTTTAWEITNIIAQGDLVFVERVDKTTAGEKSVDLPCVGVFELENGKIRVWRDYFDIGTYMNGIS
jgi:limonene-1,2-epoxide hydrolase